MGFSVQEIKIKGGLSLGRSLRQADTSSHPVVRTPFSEAAPNAWIIAALLPLYMRSSVCRQNKEFLRILNQLYLTWMNMLLGDIYSHRLISYYCKKIMTFFFSREDILDWYVESWFGGLIAIS